MPDVSDDVLDPDLDAVIARGQGGLRFPPALEAAFEADTVAARRRLLLICGMIGVLGIWFGTDIVLQMVPDQADLTRRTRWVLVSLSLGSQVLAWLIPRARWKSQHFEFMTMVNNMVVGAAIVWGTSRSDADAIFTHSAALIGVLMYAGIAARQRFRWTFATATLTLLAYCLFVQAKTPLQQLIVGSNIMMLFLGLALTLVASHGFELRERRAWLLRRQSVQMQANLAQAGEKLRELSVRDPLTHLYNRRQFDAAMGQAFGQAAVAGQPVAMLMLDVDYFKRYNDHHGHPAGDACLQSVARVLADLGEQEGGLVGRLGGEEFGMALPGRSGDEALALGRRLCAAIREAAIEHHASPVGPHVTASVGVAAVWPGRAGASPHALAQMADQALYQAKHDGRDRAAACLTLASEHVLAEVPEAPAPASMPDAGLQPSSAQAEIEVMNKVLQRGFYGLFFPRQLESVYQAQHVEERRRHLILASILGLLVFNGYTYGSRAMYPDVAPTVLNTVLMLTLIMLVAVGLSMLLPVKAWVRESLYAIGTTVVVVTLVRVLSHSQAFTVYVYAVALFLIPMFACVVARQPFWFALVPTLATLGCLGLFKPGTLIEKLIMQDTAITVINASIYTLIAAYALERGARKEWLLHEIGLRQRQALEHTSRYLQQLSVRDPLTGLSNRRQFEAEFDRIWTESGPSGQAVGLLIMDVDFFKHFNDHHGHPAGDRCLVQVGAVLAEVAARAHSFAARLGGEEFAILLPGRTQEQAMQVGQEVCAAMLEARIDHGFSAAAPHVTLSVGAASLPAGALHSAHELLKAADGALYRAKTAGRNRVGTADAVCSVQDSVVSLT